MMNARQEQEAIERACALLRWFHNDGSPFARDYPELNSDDGACLTLSKGYRGWGWYMWNSEYPDEGSVFLGRAGSEIFVIARCIVEHERKAVSP